MEEKKKGVSEDWLAFWLAIVIFLISLLAYTGTDPLGWVVSTKEWTDSSKAIVPTGKMYQSLKGEITKIEGNKLTIKKADGKEETVTVSDPAKYKVGDTYEKKGLSGFTSLVLTYIFMAVVFSIGAALMRADIVKFNIGFFFIFWLSYLCWFIGHYAYFAATDPKKSRYSLVT